MKFSSHLKCDGKIVIEMGPWIGALQAQVFASTNVNQELQCIIAFNHIEWKIKHLNVLDRGSCLQSGGANETGSKLRYFVV